MMLFVVQRAAVTMVTAWLPHEDTVAASPHPSFRPLPTGAHRIAPEKSATWSGSSWNNSRRRRPLPAVVRGEHAGAVCRRRSSTSPASGAVIADRLWSGSSRRWVDQGRAVFEDCRTGVSRKRFHRPRLDTATVP